MFPSDLVLARLCAETYSASPALDFIDDGVKSGTGVYVGIKNFPDFDVIVFRGSDDVEDWLRDFDAAMTSTPLGMVHAGFDRGLNDVHALLDQHTRPNPVITGHSLGAARAAIYGGMLVNYFDDPAKIALFGCPRPGAQQLADILLRTPINSYRNGNDPVTEVPVPFPPRLLYTHVSPLISVHSALNDDRFPLEPTDHNIQRYINALENLPCKT